MNNSIGLKTSVSLQPDKQKNSHDLQLFILWAATKKPDIEMFIDTISERFILKYASMCEWSEEYWGANLNRFYGLLPAGPRSKLCDVGGKPFLIAICEDVQPLYGPHQSLGGNIELQP
ncbi:hypothetical protein [Desulfobotulus mexicanus]|uniref:Uncharacterized protein n=1 Tax=Desulfobotulus mexicanus TaxID=2586642 RepID=A0A5Q4VHQ3_9BACT|nr:hypothetical protein [Desulfobotulus mexicanus]TYT75802.1 hypothetical protein FIM25_02540 [Desulfobotulus mexicanus]